MNRPALTVLMTVYNGGPYLRPSIEAVLGQSFRDFEFLIVDDHSTDDSLLTIRSYADARIVVCPQERNQGQTASLNRGLRLAKGEWIARMDADDLAFPQWLQRQMDFVGRHPHYAVVSTQALIIDETNRLTKNLPACQSPEEIYLKALCASPINHVGSLLRKDAVLKIGGYDETFKVIADYDLWCRLLEKGERLTSTPETLVAVRVHQGSQSIQESQRAVSSEMVELIRRNFFRLAGENIDAQQSALVAGLFYHPTSLNKEEYLTAKEILCKAYGAGLSRPGMNRVLLEKVIRRQLERIDIRRIFCLIESGNAAEVRGISAGQHKGREPFRIFVFFWLLSFMGKGTLRVIPRSYQLFRRWKASSLARQAPGQLLKRSLAR